MKPSNYSLISTTSTEPAYVLPSFYISPEQKKVSKEALFKMFWPNHYFTCSLSKIHRFSNQITEYNLEIYHWTSSLDTWLLDAIVDNDITWKYLPAPYRPVQERWGGTCSWLKIATSSLDAT